MKMTLEILNYFRNDEMVNSNTPFSIGDYDLALKKIESAKDYTNRNCFNCQKYSNQDDCVIKYVQHIDASEFSCNKWEEKW